MISLNFKASLDFLGAPVYNAFLERSLKAFDTLVSGSGAGNDFLGWLNLPSDMLNSSILAEIEEVKERWYKMGVDTVVSIGIGGSYLGAAAAIKALSPSFHKEGTPEEPEVLFAGNNLSEDYLYELLEYIKEKNVGVVVISKSGTTTEPAVTFRILKSYMEQRYGLERAKELIVAITDARKGALKGLSEKMGYKTFVIPDNVGGRFSVLTPVGLLPIALAGFDIKRMLEGAADMQRACAIREADNGAIQYAAVRNALYSCGKKIEILANYNPKLQLFGEWWKQLYGESEGKEGKGIFPAAVSNTTDLHSMGQFIQQAERNLMEVVLNVRETEHTVTIESSKDDSDGLNYLAGRRVEEVNANAFEGTLMAHVDGLVPNTVIETDHLDEYSLVELFYFFEFACGVSGYLLGVNPFDQPGVEFYKKNMFKLLGKPGYQK